MKKFLIKKLDAIWSKTVKEIAKYRCEHCGRYDSRMEAAHVVGRRHRATRWGCWLSVMRHGQTKKKYDLCGHCLCHACHQEYDEHGPLENDIIEHTIGRERKEYLQNVGRDKVAKYQDYDEIKGWIEQVGAEHDDSPYSSERTTGKSH
jgi:hypothetical protein